MQTNEEEKKKAVIISRISHKHWLLAFLGSNQSYPQNSFSFSLHKFNILFLLGVTRLGQQRVNLGAFESTALLCFKLTFSFVAHKNAANSKIHHFVAQCSDPVIVNFNVLASLLFYGKTESKTNGKGINLSRVELPIISQKTAEGYVSRIMQDTFCPAFWKSIFFLNYT